MLALFRDDEDPVDWALLPLCPTCRALPGLPCTDGRGKARKVHIDRWNLRHHARDKDGRAQ